MNGKRHDDQGQMLELVPAGSALAVLNSSEIDIQITTARRFPRSITRFREAALALATLNEDVAASMFYTLPRGKDDRGKQKFIEGPSVRLAEIIATTWGNLRVESDIVEIGTTHVTAMGCAMDLESNTAARIRVKRRITDRWGRRFNDDMIAVTCNAACAIAYREALFKIVPRAMFLGIYEQAKRVAVGDATTLTDRRNRALDWFSKQGVPPEKVLARLGKKGVEDIDLDDLEYLQGLRSALRDGEISITTAFTEEETVSKTDLIRAQIEAARAKKKGAPAMGDIAEKTEPVSDEPVSQ